MFRTETRIGVVDRKFGVYEPSRRNLGRSWDLGTIGRELNFSVGILDGDENSDVRFYEDDTDGEKDRIFIFRSYIVYE